MFWEHSWDIWNSKAAASQKAQALKILHIPFFKNHWIIITASSTRMKFNTRDNRETTDSHQIYFLKIFYSLQRRHWEHQCVLWLVYRVPVGNKIIEQALGWTEGPTHVYQGGMFEAATLQLLQNTVLSKGAQCLSWKCWKGMQLYSMWLSTWPCLAVT